MDRERILAQSFSMRRGREKEEEGERKLDKRELKRVEGRKESKVVH